MKKHTVKIFLFILPFLTPFFLPAVNCPADEIIFLNGDRLTGKLVNMHNETVTFNPELMGIITFDISKVKRLTTDEPVKINLDDSTSIITTAIAFEDGEVLITGSHTDKVVTVPPGEVFSVRKPDDGGPANWKGSISAGATKTDNDEDTMTFSSILQLERRSPKHRLRTRGILFIEREKNSETRRRETTEENFTADARYDYFFKKKWFWTTGGNYKRDIIDDLDYRVIVGSGLGYQWIDSATSNLDTIAGFAYTDEQYSDEENSYMAYLFGVTLNIKFWERLSANLDATITPKVDDPSDYIARGFGGIKLQATESFFVNFNTIFEYNSKVSRADSTDTKFLVGLGWDFL